MLRITLFLLIFIVISGCSTQELLGEHPDLLLTAEYNLNIPEPSGLSLGADKRSLYTVSDATGMIYHMALDGALLETLQFQGNDLEGIAYDSLKRFLWVVEEGQRDLIQLDLNGNEKRRFHIDFPGAANSGLEGVAVNAFGELFVVNEKNPPRLLKLDDDYEISREYAPGATSDYSGICADTAAGRWWVLSDQDAALFLWDVRQGVLKTYFLGVRKAEGLAIDFQAKTIYVVSDSGHKLYLFALE